MRSRWALAVCLLVPKALPAQTLSADVKAFVSVDAPVVALTHVRVVDGTGGPAREDQTLVISGGKIQAVGAAPAVPAGAKVMGLSGYTVIPGLVGMHDHLFYPQGGGFFAEMGFSFPRLYLACGVTTIRTTGSIEPYTDLEIKKLVDAGKAIGPKMHVTGPYLEGKGAVIPQLHVLAGPEDARKTVAFWADQGATSFKAYMHASRAELGAAIAEAHARKIKVTAHLCSVTWPEAAALGIDDFEHGPMYYDMEFAPGKEPDACPSARAMYDVTSKIEMSDGRVRALIADLVKRKIAVTSTLPVFELLVPGRPPLDQRVLAAMTPDARVNYLSRRAGGGSTASGPPPNSKPSSRTESATTPRSSSTPSAPSSACANVGFARYAATGARNYLETRARRLWGCDAQASAREPDGEASRIWRTLLRSSMGVKGLWINHGSPSTELVA